MDKVRQRLRDKGMTLSGWCRINGFNRTSVDNMIKGAWGTKAGQKDGGEVSTRILHQMKQDGLVDAE